MEKDIFLAASRGDVETLQAILAAKPNAGAAIRGYDGSTPVLMAAFAGHEEAVELLLRSPGVCTRRHLNYLRRNGTSMLWWLAQEGGRAPLIERLLKLTLKDMHPADHVRVLRNQERRDRWERERRGEADAEPVGSIVSMLWGLATTKLSSLLVMGGGAVAEAEAVKAAAAEAEKRRKKKKKRPPPPPFVHEGMGEFLVMPDRGFPEDSRETPLMAAIMRGDEASVLALLDGPLGANVNAMTIGGGMTPLHCCALEGRSAMIPLLLERDADPFVRNQDGETPKELALAHGQQACAELLEQAEAAALRSAPTDLPYLCALAAQGRHKDIKAALEQTKVHAQEEAVAAAGREGGGGSLGVGAGKKAVAAVLSQVRPYTGETLLHAAARSAEKGAEKVMRLLLQYGMKVDGGDKFGCTPLYYAALANRLPIVKVLIEKHRAHPLLCTRDRDSAWLVAGQWAHLDEDGGQRDNRALFYAMEPRVDEIEDELELALEDGEGDAAALYATGFLQSGCASPAFQAGGVAGPSKKKKRKKRKGGGAGGAGVRDGEEGEEGEEMDVKGRESLDKGGGGGGGGGENGPEVSEGDIEELTKTWDFILQPFRPLLPAVDEPEEARKARLMRAAALDPEVGGDKTLQEVRAEREELIELHDDPLQESLAKCLLRAMVVLEAQLDGADQRNLVKGGHHLLRLLGLVRQLEADFRFWLGETEIHKREFLRLMKKKVHPAAEALQHAQERMGAIQDAQKKAVDQALDAAKAIKKIKQRLEQQPPPGGAERKQLEDHIRRLQRQVDEQKGIKAAKQKDEEKYQKAFDRLKDAFLLANEDVQKHKKEKEKPARKWAEGLGDKFERAREWFDEYALAFMAVFGDHVMRVIQTAPELEEVKTEAGRVVAHMQARGEADTCPLLAAVYNRPRYADMLRLLMNDPVRMWRAQEAREEARRQKVADMEAMLEAQRKAAEVRQLKRALGVAEEPEALAEERAQRELLEKIQGLDFESLHDVDAGGRGRRVVGGVGGVGGAADALVEYDSSDESGYYGAASGSGLNDVDDGSPSPPLPPCSKFEELAGRFLERVGPLPGDPLDELIATAVHFTDSVPPAMLREHIADGLRESGVSVEAAQQRAAELLRGVNADEADVEEWTEMVFGGLVLGEEAVEARGGGGDEHAGDVSVAAEIFNRLGPKPQPLDRLLVGVIATGDKRSSREMRHVIAQEMRKLGVTAEAARGRATELLLGAESVDPTEVEGWMRKFFGGGEQQGGGGVITDSLRI